MADARGARLVGARRSEWGEPALQLAANDHRVTAPPLASGPICAAPRRSDLPPLARVETAHRGALAHARLLRGFAGIFLDRSGKCCGLRTTLTVRTWAKKSSTN